ncbi:MAG TPA: sigma-54-dependent Fis family transcriptional regulator [Rhodospirillales bacterium]|nr:sigma-54-dependent Fis family transcriptional regulator [Rhodospirillales bacterium]
MTATIVHRSRAHGALLERLAKVARSSAEILISGPTGVGKELYAAYVHDRSPRASKPFVAVNCANLSAEVIENEIFGHARGAFTGAVTAVNGIAAAADGGTLFLDEIDTLPLTCQAKILRFTQFREYRRLGEAFTRKCDVRLITASNADLSERVRAGSFRADLFFRLRVVPVEIPSLAERREDIPALTEYFVARYAREYEVEPVVFGEAARARMMSYHWPGNVRELENCVRYLICLGLDRPVHPADLPLLDEAAMPVGAAQAPAPEGEADLLDLPLKEAKSMVVEGFEKMYIDKALHSANGNVAEAARRSGKHRRAFFELMRRYGIGAEVYRAR